MEGKIVLYSEDNSNIYVSVYFDNDTFWMTQKALSELFGCSTDNISLHLKNIYASDELDELSTTEEISVVQQEGTRQVKRKARYYSLDAIIAVGYRVNSKKATKFRQWTTKCECDCVLEPVRERESGSDCGSRDCGLIIYSNS